MSAIEIVYISLFLLNLALKNNFHAFNYNLYDVE